MHNFLHGTPVADAWQYVAHQPSASEEIQETSTITRKDDRNLEEAVGANVLHDDDENPDMDPKRWSPLKKLRVLTIITFYTFAVYAGSAIYITSVELVASEYLTDIQTALLGLSLCVLGYGVGPLLWAPLSEIAWIGRNPIYIITAFVFMIISMITAITTSLPGFLFLRFVQGFFGSPCLANGGASLHDIFDGRHLPLVQSIWVAGAYAGPAIGPVMASYLVAKSGWRVSMWEIVACSSAAFMMLAILPETYLPKIVHQQRKKISVPGASVDEFQGPAGSKAQFQLRTDEVDGNENENDNRINIRGLVLNALIKPIQISFQDPAIAYVNIYTSYLYSCYYTFFDGFPMVYTATYGFAPSRIGLVFLPIIVGCAIAMVLYCIYILGFTSKKFEDNPEARLRPALVAVFAAPIGIFLFG